MFTDSLSDYFEGVAAKYLTAVDAQPDKSNQHEIGGLPSVGFKQFLGAPAKGEKSYFRATLAYVSDDEDSPVVVEDEVTWYDVRHERRSPEYRLYYKSNLVTEQLSAGDFFLVGKRTDGSLLLIFCPPDSTVEAQLRHMFGLGSIEDSFSRGLVSSSTLLLPVRMLLENLGLVTAERLVDKADWLDILLTRFGKTGFPKTAEFSAFARETLEQACDPVSDPDACLMAWMDHEELLFRTYERHIVQQRLREGFGKSGDEVEEFISYSLSVQNRRKSRVGHAFEAHLEALFLDNKLQFERPRGKIRVTENNSKPDFMFPSFSHYHDMSYPSEQLIVLGAKTTCKDRWRQVLAEANRVERKHLITLEPAISVAQTEEMSSAKLQLVVPTSIQSTYSAQQRPKLLHVSEFIEHARAKRTA